MRIANRFLGGVLALFAFASLAADAPVPIRWIEIRGTINPASANFLKSSIQQASQEKAQALIVELDTPGGLVTSVREMAQAIDDSSVPVIVFTTPAGASATSAGALLMLASHLAAISPGAAIGAAHPVDTSGKGVDGVMGEKILNDTAAFARGLAELRGRNRELAEKVVTKSQSLTAQEALDKNLVELLAKDRAELLQKLNGREIALKDATKRRLDTAQAVLIKGEMSWGQRLLNFLANPTIASLLMSLGLLCIYVEITTAGIGLAGVAGAICILIAFMSFQMLPIRMGGLLLMGVGLVFLVAEIFVTTKGVLALGGTLSFILGLLWVMDPMQTDLRVSPAVWVPLSVVLFMSALGIGWIIRRMQKQVENALKQVGGHGALGLQGYSGHVSAVSADGMSGKIVIRGEVWDFDSREKMTVGQTATVDRMNGMRALIRPGSGK